jgi:hypothetical protein
MRQILYYATIAMMLITLSSCEYRSGQERNPEGLGKTIWDIAYLDIVRVNEVLDFVAHYNYYLSIEEEAKSKVYLEKHLIEDGMIPEIEINGNRHILTYNTTYGTTYNIEIEMFSDYWHVIRTGGRGYDITIRVGQEADYSVDIARLYSRESVGSGQLEVNLNYTKIEYASYVTEGIPEIEFMGNIVMVDSEASSEKPLIVTTDIIHPLCFSNELYSHYPIKGVMTITVEDMLYGTRDEIKATIVNTHQRYGVHVESLGTKRIYYLD